MINVQECITTLHPSGEELNTDEKARVVGDQGEGWGRRGGAEGVV